MSSVHEKWICPPWGQSPWKKETAGHIFCFRARYLLRFSRRQGLCSSVYFKFCKHKSVKLQSVLLFFKFLLALRFLRLGWSMNISHNLFWLWLMACLWKKCTNCGRRREKALRFLFAGASYKLWKPFFRVRVSFKNVTVSILSCLYVN